MADIKYWAILDYVIFGLILAVSTVIGIYSGFKHRKKMTSSEYLVANRNLPWFPLCISLVVTFFSSVYVLVFVSQVYMTGVTYTLQVVAFLPPIILSAEVFVPLFRRLQLTSVNEYLELRYSKGIRLLGCFFFILQYVIFLSIMIYVPCKALEEITNMPKLATIITTGVLCTLYTTLGGMRGIVWAHIFQSLIIFIGIVGVAVGGAIRIGSFEEIYNTALKYKRLEINYDPDPRSYHTVWGSVIGMQFLLFPLWTINQPTVQRIISTQTLKDAKKALYVSFVGILFIFVILTFDALVIFTAFIGCNPKQSEKIKTEDWILPYYIFGQFNDYMGIPALLIAAVFCFTQSTLSSALNSISAVFLEDIVKSIHPTITDQYQVAISKVVTCVFGLIVTGLTFGLPILDNRIIQLVIELFSVIGGPYFAIFVMGIFTQRANSAGAAVGSLVGLCVGCAFAVGQMVYPSNHQLPPISTAQCTNVFNKTFVYPHHQTHDNVIADIVSISYMWHGMISILVTCAVCLLVSLCCSRCCDSAFLDKKLLYSYRGCCMCSCSCCKEKADYDCEVYDQELIQNGPFADRGDNYGESNT